MCVEQHLPQLRRQLGRIRMLPYKRDIFATVTVCNQLCEERAGAERTQADSLAEIFRFSVRQAQRTLVWKIIRRRNRDRRASSAESDHHAPRRVPKLCQRDGQNVR